MAKPSLDPARLALVLAGVMLLMFIVAVNETSTPHYHSPFVERR